VPPYTPQPAVLVLRNLGPYLSTIDAADIDLQMRRFVFGSARAAGESAAMASALADASALDPYALRDALALVVQDVPERAQQFWGALKEQAARRFMETVQSLDFPTVEFVQAFGGLTPAFGKIAEALPLIQTAYALWDAFFMAPRAARQFEEAQDVAHFAATVYGKEILRAEVPVALRLRLGLDDAAQVELITEQIYPMIETIFDPWLDNLGRKGAAAMVSHKKWCDDWTRGETCYFWPDARHAGWGAIDAANDVNRDGLRDSLARVMAGLLVPKREIGRLQPPPPELTTPPGWGGAPAAPAAAGGALPLVLVGGLIAALN